MSTRQDMERLRKAYDESTRLLGSLVDVGNEISSIRSDIRRWRESVVEILAADPKETP